MKLRPTYLVLLVALLAATLLPLSLQGAPSALDRLDGSLIAWRLAHPAAGALILLDAAGSVVPWVLLMAVVAVAASRASVAAMLETLAVMVSSELGTAVVKLVVGRDRPAGAAVGDLLTTASYPSGHVVRAVIATGAILLLVRCSVGPRIATVAAGTGIVILMAVARVSGGAHHTSDVIGGVLLGAAILAAWALVRERRPPRKRAPGWAS